MKYHIVSLLCVFAVGCCVQGPKGNTGASGQVGTQGPAGNPVEPCTESAVTNGVIISCPNGDSAIILNGTPGQVGPQGIQGQPGAAGETSFSTNVSFIQFCPNEGPTTYGHFPEQGLVVGDQILGVYYDGVNAWLAEIVPGTYNSTATGLGCTFQVNVGGTVQQL